MIDTHTHLYDEAFGEDEATNSRPRGSAAVERAIKAGVRHMIFPNVDVASARPLIELHKAYPENTSVAIGLHPTEVTEGWKSTLGEINEIFKGASCRQTAVGEIGIDLYWDKQYEAIQMECFEYQCLKAVKNQLPVIIHCREGLDQVLEVLEGIKGLKGVFHCFTGSIEDVAKIRDKGDYYFGIGGVSTFKKANLGESIREIGKERILLETDSPYLAPTPYRGKRNESSYLPLICRKVGEELGVVEEEISRITDDNARRLFGV